ACLLSTMLLTWGSALCHAGVQLVFDAARDEVASVAFAELSDVKSLKQRLHQQHGLPPRFRQRLLHLGNTLSDAVMLDSVMDRRGSVSEGVLKRRLDADPVPDTVTDLQVVTLAFSQCQPLELWRAAGQGRLAEVESLLQLPVDPDLRYFSTTPLMRASENGHADVARLLLEAGAQTDLHRHWGETALMDAAGGGHSQVVQLLLEAGAQKDLRDLESSTALRYAAFNGRAEVVRLLLEAGAEKDMRDEDGGTALMDAASGGYVAIVQILLEAGAQKDAHDNVGGTALMHSAFHGHSAVVRLLLEASVEKEARDAYGKTALIYATERKFKDVQRLLEAHVIQLDGANRRGQDSFRVFRALFRLESINSRNGLPACGLEPERTKWEVRCDCLVQCLVLYGPLDLLPLLVSLCTGVAMDWVVWISWVAFIEVCLFWVLVCINDYVGKDRTKIRAVKEKDP
ncbi:unnamed protein product, partial [Symbiodinium sp. KB8]